MDEQHSQGVVAPAIFIASAAGTVLVIGLIGAVIAWLAGTRINSSIALAYYFVGSIVFLVGSFPTGGFSLMRGRSQRRPMGGGAFAAPSMLLGALLIGVGIAVDITQPF